MSLSPFHVFQLFSETTSLYKPTTTPSPPESRLNVPQTAPGTPNPPWITRDHHQSQHHQPHHHPRAHPGSLDCFLPSSPCDGSVAGGFHLHDPVSTTDDHAGFQVDLSHPFGSESSSVWQSWRNDNPWGEEEEEEKSDGGRTLGGGREGEHNWRGGQPPHHEVYGSQREPALPGTASNPFQHASSGFRLQEPACSTSPSFSFPHGHSEHQHPGSSHYLPMTSPRRARPWAGAGESPSYVGGQRRGGLVGSPGYGNHFRTGQERKRMAAGGGMFSSGNV